MPSLPPSLKFARLFPLGFHIYISFCINICQSFFNSVFLVHLLFPCALFPHLCVTNCSNKFPAISTVSVSPSLILCMGGHLPFSAPIIMALTFQIPNLKRRDLVSLVVSTLVCLYTSLHLVVIIWHNALQVFPTLSNQMCTFYLLRVIAQVSQFGFPVATLHFLASHPVPSTKSCASIFTTLQSILSLLLSCQVSILLLILLCFL